MTTIPIEVIVQDAKAPIVPGEDGTNTNTNTEAAVAVPDTGGSGSNIFTGSASSIVLPVVLLVLALGSIVAILIHKYHKQKNNKTTRKEKLAVATSSTVVILAATVLIGNLLIPATKAATSDITDSITPAEDKVSITVTRNGGSAEASIESTATITSTSDFGYKVLLSMAEGVETSNLYLDGDEESEYYIASVEAENEEGVELADNTWGYALEEGSSYNSVPLLDSAVTVAQGDEPVEDGLLSIYYGVKVSSDLPAGTYSGGEVECGLVSLEPTISTLTYMQDFAKLSEAGKASVRRSMTEDGQYTLKDSRDQKDYFVSKLADGNVWMTQNLDLDLSTETTLTPDNTNISSNWTPANSTITFTDAYLTGWQNNSNAPYSADPGELYIYGHGTATYSNEYASLEACQEEYPDCSMHNQEGNYYNWSAAVANNSTSSITTRYTNVDTDICPAGWELPKGMQSDDKPMEENQLGTLVDSYGILGTFITAGCNTCLQYHYTEGGLNLIRTAPLWLAQGGIIDGYMRNYYRGGGYYWSSTVSSSDDAFSLNFDKDYVYPTAVRSRGYGYSVRCVAQ